LDLSAPDPRASRITALVFFVVFLDLVGFGLIIPLLPFYVEHLGGDARTVGMLLACFSAAQLVTTPILGRLSDRVGRRPVILFSLLGNALAMGLFAAATQANALWMIFASRILAGATSGNLAACQATVADVTSGPQRAAGMGRIGAGIGMGLVAGPLLSGELSKLSPSAPALGAAALGFCGVIATFFLLPETHRPTPLTPASSPASSPATPRPSLGAMLRRWQVVAVLVVYFFLFLALTNHQTSFTLLTARRFHWTEVQVGRSFAMLGLVMFLVQGVFIRRLVTLAPEHVLFAIGATGISVGTATIGLASSPAVLVLGLFVMAAGFGLTQPIVSTIASRQAGEEHQGAVLGFAQSAGGLARAVGPIFAGFLFQKVSPGAPYAVAATAAILAALLGLRLK